MNTNARNRGMTRRSALRGFFFAAAAALVALRAPAHSAEIERRPVESSVLASAGYDAKARVLEIEFRSGAIYRYLDVPGEVYRGLFAAESKGNYFGKSIRDKFRCERVRPRKIR